MSLLEISELKVDFSTPEGMVRAVDKMSLEIRNGEALGLIGESGCGKSTMGLSVMRLLPQNAHTEGRILYRGRDLLKIGEHEMRQVRGKEIAMIFQDPLTSLNPVLTIGEQICEAIRLHQGLGKKQAKERAVEILKALRVPLPSKRVSEYPHQLSSGMRQRAMIAVALASKPSLIIADEPTRGLDLIRQAEVLKLMKELKSSTSMLFITHDLGVAAGVCDHIAVMYAGEIVEYSSAQEILNRGKHPYTLGLLDSIPRKGLKPIEGSSPSLINPPQGCKFHPRCSSTTKQCSQKRPGEIEIGEEHFVRCFLYA